MEEMNCQTGVPEILMIRPIPNLPESDSNRKYSAAAVPKVWCRLHRRVGPRGVRELYPIDGFDPDSSLVLRDDPDLAVLVTSLLNILAVT